MDLLKRLIIETILVRNFASIYCTACCSELEFDRATIISNELMLGKRQFRNAEWDVFIPV
jgi:hypothetical protein